MHGGAVNLLLLLDSDFLPDGTVQMTGRRAQHAREVLRAEPGETLRVGRLGGLVGTGEVLENTPGLLRLRISLTDPPPPRKQPRCAFLEGFSLHANTHLHANDRQGLERLCRYGARGALALERLSRAEDGRIAWRMKRPLPDGTTHLFFTGLELLRRVASLVPPPKLNLTRFHGVFAPGAKLRPFLVPQAGAEEESEAPQAEARKEARKERTARVDQAGLLQRTFAVDVFACVRCGGRRRVLAYVKEVGGVRAILEHLRLPTASASLAAARGPPQSAWC